MAAVWSWRASFGLLALAGLVLAAVIQAFLSEPARGGQSRLPVGAGELPRDAGREADALPREVRRAAVTPHSEQVLHDDPTRRSLWWVIRYVLSIRTKVVLIIASALGYSFFAGLRTFAVPFADCHRPKQHGRTAGS